MNTSLKEGDSEIATHSSILAWIFPTQGSNPRLLHCIFTLVTHNCLPNKEGGSKLQPKTTPGPLLELYIQSFNPHNNCMSLAFWTQFINEKWKDLCVHPQFCRASHNREFKSMCLQLHNPCFFLYTTLPHTWTIIPVSKLCKTTL